MTKDTKSQTATALKAIRPDIPDAVAQEKADGWWKHLGTVIVGVLLTAGAMLMREYAILSTVLVIAGVFLCVSGGHAMSGESTDALKERGTAFGKVAATIIGAFRGKNGSA